MATESPISFEPQDQHVVLITIRRPDRRNALDPASMAVLNDALVRFDEDPDLRVAVITGEGRQAFCAGADIHATLPDAPFMSGYFSRRTDAANPLYIRNISFQRLALTKPLIAAVNGVAVGGGMELALNCDLCVASVDARFGLTEARIGSIPAVAGIQRLMHAAPRAAAMQLIMTGEIVDAARACALGVVSELLPADDLLPRALHIARQIAANAPLAVKAAKLLADKAFSLPLGEAAQFEELLWGHLLGSHDRIEGRKAFAERRTPRFNGT